MDKILDENEDEVLTEKDEEYSIEVSKNDNTIIENVDNICGSPNEQRPRKKLKTLNQPDKGDIAFSAMQTIFKEMESRQRDQYSAFAEVVAHKIRKLPTDAERDIVEFKINEILFQASMGHFRLTNIPPRPSPSNTPLSSSAHSTSDHQESLPSDNSNDQQNIYDFFGHYQR